VHKFYPTSESAIGAMYEAVFLAEQSIYWETFIFRNDTFPAYDFMKVFKEKAKEGKKVVLIIDGFGGFWYDFGKTLEKDLRESGVEVLFFRSWFRRIHRKILIVDEKKIFIGGVNVAQEYMKWLDLNVLLTGKHIVATTLRSFARSYRFCGGVDERLLSLPKMEHLHKGKLWLIEQWPHIDKLFLRRHYKDKIAEANKKITFVTPYFFPHTWLVRSLKDAIGRGVMVEVILPKKTDASFSTFANHVFVKLLENSGIHFYWSNTMIHAKTLLIDGEEGMVGSINLDQMSFDWNVEAGVFFRRKDMVRDLSKIIEEWRKNSTPYNSQSEVWRWYHKPFALLVRILSPII